MNKLLKKELRLTAAPITYFFLTFALMTLIPGYPILVGRFFITLGIFYTFQMARESNDILYTALLPCKKQDVVRAKYTFCVLIELLGWLLILFALFNSVFLGGFFRTAYGLGKPFILYSIAGFAVICLAEALHHFPGMAAMPCVRISPSFSSVARVKSLEPADEPAQKMVRCLPASRLSFRA